MKLLAKLLIILVISAFFILITASFLLQDKVANLILKSLNKNISTKLDVGTVNLSFLRKFPNGSIELHDVIVHSSPDFDEEEFKGINTDTLMVAKSVLAEFGIIDLINGRYNIGSLSVRDGKFNFFTDTAGMVNYEISVKNQNAGKDVFTIDLERINLNDVKAYYNNLATELIITGFVKNGKLKSRISGTNIDFTAVTELEINSFQLFKTEITHPISAILDLTLQSSEKGVRFKKGSLAIDNYNFSLEGFVSSDNILDLNLSGRNIDIGKVRNYLPEKYSSLVSEYKPSGKLILECSIKGPLTRTLNPHIEINCDFQQGEISYGRSNVSLNSLSFAGHFSNGSKNHLGTSSVIFKDLKIKLGASEYTGSVSVSDFYKPKTKIHLRGKVFPEEVKEFFNIKEISKSGGSVDIDLKLLTDFWPKDSITLNDIVDLEPQGKLTFNSFTLGWTTKRILFSNVNGDVFVSDIYRPENLSFEYEGQKIKIDGEFRNLPAWLAGRQVTLIAAADVSFNRLIPDVFLNSEKPGLPGTPEFPEDIVADLNFKIDSIRYKTFSSAKITGNVNYKPRMITFKSLNLNAFNGSISGNGFIVQNSNRSIISKGSFDVATIDINKAFKTFHNFGQDFIKAENLSGSLSGTISVLLPMDAKLSPRINSVTAEGRFILSDGALINFDPVKKLSSFIELSELENIHFQKLENDFFIRNNILYIPQMDVRSSAVDLLVNGTHSFDNVYEYHVKMLLSQILSKKRKGNNQNISEFGIVQDDGLGRTSLLLKVESKGEDIKVGYDLKAATMGVKKNIKSEKQALKTILNQEYGWYKTDPPVSSAPAPAGKKSRFKISWDETDSIKTSGNPIENEKKPVKRLLKD